MHILLCTFYSSSAPFEILFSSFIMYYDTTTCIHGTVGVWGGGGAPVADWEGTPAQQQQTAGEEQDTAGG